MAATSTWFKINFISAERTRNGNVQMTHAQCLETEAAMVKRIIYIITPKLVSSCFGLQIECTFFSKHFVLVTCIQTCVNVLF